MNVQSWDESPVSPCGALEASNLSSTPACIGLGSNLGDRRAMLEFALARVTEAPDIDIRAVSTFRETPPVGGPGGQPPFLNAAAVVSTRLEPEDFLQVLNRIEDEAGRVRTVRWGERTLDLDLLLFGDRIVDQPGLIVPHPRMAIRRFVIEPLAEVAPEFVDPRTGRAIAQLLANLDRRPSVLALLTRPSADLPTPWLNQLLERLDAIRRAGGVSPLSSSRLDSLVEPPNAIPIGRNPPLHSDGPATPSDPEHWEVFDLCLDAPGALSIPPTLVVASRRHAERLGLPEPAPARPRPFGRETPLVVLESDEPESALSETLAACAATRAG